MTPDFLTVKIPKNPPAEVRKVGFISFAINALAKVQGVWRAEMVEGGHVHN